MERLNINLSLMAKAVYIKGSSDPLRDRVIYIAGNFLVVGENAEDASPVWYNMDTVERLEGVAKIPQTREWRASWF